MGMFNIWRDLRIACRNLAKQPAFSLMIVGILAAAIFISCRKMDLNLTIMYIMMGIGNAGALMRSHRKVSLIACRVLREILGRMAKLTLRTVETQWSIVES